MVIAPRLRPKTDSRSISIGYPLGRSGAKPTGLPPYARSRYAHESPKKIAGR